MNLPNLSLEEAENLLSKEVYESSALLERLEGAGKVGGNGHHMRQIVVGKAVLLLRSRWHNQVEAAEAHTKRPLYMLAGYFKTMRVA
jgi:hypothetical protein